MGHRSALLVGLLGAVWLSAPALAVPKVVMLGGDATGDSDPTATCGALAASPDEPGWKGRGLKDGQVFLDGALTACEAAIRASPDSTEVKAWLGRTYVLVGRPEDA